jgi:hypothetical protein
MCGCVSGRKRGGGGRGVALGVHMWKGAHYFLVNSESTEIIQPLKSQVQMGPLM